MYYYVYLCILKHSYEKNDKKIIIQQIQFCTLYKTNEVHFNKNCLVTQCLELWTMKALLIFF